MVSGKVKIELKKPTRSVWALTLWDNSVNCHLEDNVANSIYVRSGLRYRYYQCTIPFSNALVIAFAAN